MMRITDIVSFIELITFVATHVILVIYWYKRLPKRLITKHVGVNGPNQQTASKRALMITAVGVAAGIGALSTLMTVAFNTVEPDILTGGLVQILFLGVFSYIYRSNAGDRQR